jgi:hypothetical protein
MGDLAELFWVETRVLNQSVKRKFERFPEDFMFQLIKNENDNIENIYHMYLQNNEFQC